MFIQQVVNGLLFGSVYALSAIGLNLIYGVLRFITVAHGEVIMLGAYAGFFLATLTNSLAIALVGGVAAGLVLGYLLDLLLFRWVREREHTTPLVMTLGLVILFQEIMRISVMHGQPVRFPRAAVVTGALEFGPLFVPYSQLYTFGTAVILVGVFHWLFYHTQAGLGMRAMADRVDVARLLGVDPGRLGGLTMGIACALGTGAGVMVAVTYSIITPYIGHGIGFKSLAVMLLAGAGNFVGAMASGLIIGVVEAIAVGYISSSYRDAIAFVFIITILMFRPNGLFGSPYQGVK